jgi:hypothetical protein
MNKHLIILLGTLLTGLAALAADQGSATPANALLKSDTVIWAGLDYSLVRMYGTKDFKEPDNIFPHMLDSWNELFLRERISTLSSTLKKKVEPDSEQMAERNKLAKPDQVIRQDGNFASETEITAKDIADAVRSYKLSKQSGLGLAFIVDRLVKSQGCGAVYLVFFDVATREVVASERVIAKANGVGFRNYWFGVIKGSESGLKKYR